MCVNKCSIVLGGNQSVIAVWYRDGGQGGGVMGRMWGIVVLMLSQQACAVGNSMGRARIVACRCQVGPDRSEYRLCELACMKDKIKDLC